MDQLIPHPFSKNIFTSRRRHDAQNFSWWRARLLQKGWGALFVALYILFVPVKSLAAGPMVNFVFPSGTVAAGDTFTVDVQLDSDGIQVNAMEASILYPTDRLRFLRASREQSALTLWPEEPHADETAGTIRFSGGRPGGFVASGAQIITLYFQVYKTGDATVSLDPAASAVYRNDGLGTRIALPLTAQTLSVASTNVDFINLSSPTHPFADSWSSSRSVVLQWIPETNTQYSYLFGQESQTPPDDEPESVIGEFRQDVSADGVYYFSIKKRVGDGAWSGITQRRILIDATQPEPFALTLLPAASVGEAAVLSWVTVDATSGIRQSLLAVDGTTVGPVTSPLTLLPSWKGKTLTVTVIDTAGNQRSASWAYTVPAQHFWQTRSLLWESIMVLAAIALLLIAIWLRRTRRPVVY